MRISKFDATHMESRLVFQGPAKTKPNGSGAPALLTLGVLSLRLHPLTQNAQIPQGNIICEGGACILGSATPPIPTAEFQRSPILGFSCIYVYTL